MVNYKGTALVTGASSGIGASFAGGMDVVLVARSMEKLEALAVELARKYSIRVDAIRIDLSDPGGADRLFHETEARRIQVTMLINNAGLAP